MEGHHRPLSSRQKLSGPDRLETDVQITVNGTLYITHEDMTLLKFLREKLGLTGTKEGCSEGICGTCSVIADGKLIKSCRRMLSKLDGSSVITIEGLSDREKAVYSYAFAEAGAVQCGFCTPGMIMAAKALIDSCPEPSRDDVRKAIRGNICRCTGYVKIEDAILLSAEMLRTGKDIPSSDDDTSLSGRMKRIDAIEKALGQGAFADDIKIEGMVYASAIRSPSPRARIISIDAAEAARDPDFIRIIKAEDVPYNRHGHIVPDWPVLVAEGDITRYIGDAVCLIVAKTAEGLDRIKKLVDIRYEELQGVYSPEEAMKDEIPVHPDRSNILCVEKIARGDADNAIASSDIVIEDTFETPFTEHAFMEPECAVAVPDEDGLVVYASDQSVYDDKREIVRMLCIPEDKVRIRSTYVGGGFGGKEDMSVQHHAALASFITGLPVKVRLTRQESLIVHPKRHPMKMHFTLGAGKNGRINGLKAEILADTGAYASLGGPVLQRACTHASGPYNFQNFKVTGTAVYTNNVPAGAYRGFGVTQSCFAIELLIDKLSSLTDLDPYEIRMLNALRPGNVMPNGQIASPDTAIVECLESVKDAYYSSNRTGIAVALKNSGIGVGNEDTGRCTISIEDGLIHIRSSAACMGQGVATVELQIASAVLDLPASAFAVELPDTSRTPDSGTSTASRQTAFTGEAVRLAALKLKEDLNTHTIAELEGNEYYAEFSYPTDPITSDKPNPVSHLAYSYSAQVAEIGEDGKVSRITAACDAGRIINMTATEGQIEGGVLMGMGFALTENFRIENGIVKSKYGTLGLLRSTDRPEIKPILVSADDKLPSSFGAKGIGELCTIPTAPAIANAYRRIDGIERKSLPLERTPYRK